MSLFSGLAELMVQVVVYLCGKCEIGNDEIPENDCFSTTHVFMEG